MTDQNALKRAVAAKALDYVVDGMKLGLGSGTTAEIFLELLAPRIRGGQKLLSRSVSCTLGEGVIAKELEALQQRYADLDIGSYPYFRRSGFGVTLVLRGTEQSRLEAALEELKGLIRDLGGDPQEAAAED